MNKFIISTDSGADLLKSYLEDNNIYCIIIKRITKNIVAEELYSSYDDYKKFYENLDSGIISTTSQLNKIDLKNYFQKILDREEGDIIHISLSSGLSKTYDNAKEVADEINKNLINRKIYIIDSLSATLGMAMLINNLLKMRNDGAEVADAIGRIEIMRDYQQTWVIVGNLSYLKRGGRLKSIKSAIGNILNVKPIMIINAEGKLVIERTLTGAKSAINYILNKMDESIQAGIDFSDSTVYIAHSLAPKLLEQIKTEIKKRFGDINIKIGMIGPIVGTHVGSGTVGLVFEGTKRLNIYDDISLKEELNSFFVACFYSILNAEERNLELLSEGNITLKEIHLIEVVFQSREAGENNFTAIAKRLNITLGTLTTSFHKLEKKGYLFKRQDLLDKRIFYIEPTQSAEIINNQHIAFHNKMIDEIEKSLNKAEKQKLIVALKKLQNYFDSL